MCQKKPRGFFWYILGVSLVNFSPGGFWYILCQNGGFFFSGNWGGLWYSPQTFLNHTDNEAQWDALYSLNVYHAFDSPP